VCDTNKYGEIVEVVETSADPPSNLVMTGFYTFLRTTRRNRSETSHTSILPSSTAPPS
jgi:dTDP-glucose pyrophosphorylase